MSSGGTTHPTRWTTVIDARNRWWRVDLRELIRYRDLIALFIKRDFITQYKQTILGPLWFLLQPLLSTFTFLVIFGKIAQIPTDDVPKPLFYMGGLVFWNFFSTTVTQISVVLTGNVQLFSKVYFPRLAIPIAQTIAGLGRFVIQLALFFAFFVYFLFQGMPSSLGPSLALILPVLLHFALLAIGFGLIVSALTTRYRDLQVGLSFGMQLWMFATPIVYPLSLVPEKWRWLYALNPVVPPMEVCKHVFFGTPMPLLGEYLVSLGTTGLFLLLGLALFNKVQNTFIDTV